jgi:hypothetical protein
VSTAVDEQKQTEWAMAAWVRCARSWRVRGDEVGKQALSRQCPEIRTKSSIITPPQSFARLALTFKPKGGLWRQTWLIREVPKKMLRICREYSGICQIPILR